MKWLEKFVDRLSKVLKEPPYLLFLFISAVMALVSLVSKQHFEQIWIFFIYSAMGAVWRYMERDFIGNNFLNRWKDEHGKYRPYTSTQIKYRRAVVIMYHVGNLILAYYLLMYLNLI